MTSSQKKVLYRIITGGVLFILALLLGEWIPMPEAYRSIFRLALFLVPYLVVAYDILWSAVRNMIHGQLLDENFLMCIASIGAFALGEYPEAVAVILFYQVGELFQSYAVNRSRQSISDLMDIRPDYANIEVNGQLKQVDPEEIGIGDIVVVKPGEKVPLDGVVVDGASTIDTSALTGESVPRDVSVGNEVISGCINKSGLLRIRASKLFEESTVSKILELVENASEKKAHTENFITRFARYYTPIVVVCAVALGVIPPLLFSGAWAEWIERALIFLMVSCPCALVISVPMSFFGGIGGASKCGILVKGSNYLEALAKAEIVVFDKTGTLTKGTFKVTAVHPDEISEEKLLEMAALSEGYSDHPISNSLKEAYGKEIDLARISDAREVAGHGIQATVDGHKVYTGNGKLMAQAGVEHRDCSLPGTVVHVAVDGEYAGHIIISDEIKPDAALVVQALKAEGVRKTVMLTGDTKAMGEHVAKTLGLDEVYTDLLPGDKVDRVEALLNEKSKGGQLVFVGDGINDAPVLSRADIGIAMGALGSDAAIEAADIVLMDDQPTKIATAMRIARKTLRIVRQNIIFALGLKCIVLVLGAFGMANMWEAMFVDVGVSIIAILNASRALAVKNLQYSGK